MAKRGRKKSKIQRDSFTTTLDPRVLNRVQLMDQLLRVNGEKPKNMNEYIEEGLKMVMRKNKEKIDVNLEF
jgi:hypothetical protein